MKRTLTLALALALVLSMIVTQSGLAASADAEKNITLRMSWWGGDSRNARMNEVLDLYESLNPGITVTREYTGWGDYWTKFATQASVGTQPDVIPFVMQSIQEYIDKGVALPLQDYVDSGVINLSDWSSVAISPGVVNGELYAITYALTAQAVLYNAEYLTDAGMDLPPENWTTDEFVAYCTELADKLPAGMYAVESAAYSDHALESYMRSIGKSLYLDGQLGFDKEDLTSWFTMWETLRKAGATPSAELTAEIYGAPYETTMFGSNRAGMVFQNANLIPTFEGILGTEVFAAREPRSAADAPGEFLQPTAFGISSKSQYPQEAAELINWLVNDVDGNLIFKADYGVPGDPDVFDAIVATATPGAAKNFGFIELLLGDTQLPANNTRVEGSAQIMDVVLRGVYEDISSGASSIEEGVDRFFEEVSSILGN